MVIWWFERSLSNLIDHRQAQIDRETEQYAEVKELVFSEDFESTMDEKRESGVS